MIQAILLSLVALQAPRDAPVRRLSLPNCRAAIEPQCDGDLGVERRICVLAYQAHCNVEEADAFIEDGQTDEVLARLELAGNRYDMVFVALDPTDVEPLTDFFVKYGETFSKAFEPAIFAGDDAIREALDFLRRGRQRLRSLRERRPAIADREGVKLVAEKVVTRLRELLTEFGASRLKEAERATRPSLREGYYLEAAAHFREARLLDPDKLEVSLLKQEFTAWKAALAPRKSGCHEIRERASELQALYQRHPKSWVPELAALLDELSGRQRACATSTRLIGAGGIAGALGVIGMVISFGTYAAFDRRCNSQYVPEHVRYECQGITANEQAYYTRLVHTSIGVGITSGALLAAALVLTGISVKFRRRALKREEGARAAFTPVWPGGLALSLRF